MFFLHLSFYMKSKASHIHSIVCGKMQHQQTIDSLFYVKDDYLIIINEQNLQAPSCLIIVPNKTHTKPHVIFYI